MRSSEADVLHLRPLVVADAEVMAHVLADPSLYEFTGGEPPTREELARRYAIQVRGRSADGSERWINSIIVLGTEPIGFVQATIPVNGGPAEIAWVVGRRWQGRGHAGRAAQLLVDDLAGQGIVCVVAHIHPGHHASQRIAAGLGLNPTTTVVDGEVRWTGPLPRS